MECILKNFSRFGGAISFFGEKSHYTPWLYCKNYYFYLTDVVLMKLWQNLGWWTIGELN